MGHMTDELDEMGPIDFVVLEYPPGRGAGPGMRELLDLVDHGVVHVLDLVFVRKGTDGGVSRATSSEVTAGSGADLTVFDGAASGLLDDDDIAQAGEALEPGSTGVVLVYENSWAAPFARAVRKGGGSLVATGRIPVQALLASLDQAEAASAPR
jgi:hypothetical protein